MDFSVRRMVHLVALLVPFAFSEGVAAQNLIQGAEVTLSPFTIGSNVVSAAPLKLSSIAYDQQNPTGPIGIRQANGEANNLTGVLRASAGFVGVCCGFQPAAAATSAIGGIVKPVGSAPLGSVQTATLTFDFHGAFDPTGAHEIDTLNGFLQVIRVFDSVVVPPWNPPYAILRPSFTFQGDATSATGTANVGGNPSYERADLFSSDPSDLHARVYVTIPFVVGESFRVTAQLSAASSLNPSFTDSTGSLGAVNAMNTGVLSISLPDGFSLESPDGLLSQALAVPESGTIGLMSIGLVVVGIALRRHRTGLA